MSYIILYTDRKQMFCVYIIIITHTSINGVQSPTSFWFSEKNRLFRLFNGPNDIIEYIDELKEEGWSVSCVFRFCPSVINCMYNF